MDGAVAFKRERLGRRDNGHRSIFRASLLDNGDDLGVRQRLMRTKEQGRPAPCVLHVRRRPVRYRTRCCKLVAAEPGGVRRHRMNAGARRWRLNAVVRGGS
jgi:hypothetical protein